MNRAWASLLALVTLSVTPVEQDVSPAHTDARANVEQNFSSAQTARSAARKTHGLDPSVPLVKRVKPAPASLLGQFSESPAPPSPDGTPDTRPLRKATTHGLSEHEREAFVAALEGLAPLQQRVLAEHLHAVYFIDAPEMAGTAMTMPALDYDGAAVAFDIMFRGSVFREDVSEWLTSKERACFDSEGSTTSVSVEAGTLGAIRYALLHEATHVVDKALGLTPAWRTQGPAPDAASSPFTRGVWTSPLEIASPYASPILREVTFNPGTSLSIARAPEVYAALARTPFVSLYASRSWSEDVAELVAVAHWTTTLGQPFRFVARGGGREVAVYEPMASPLVRQRLGAIAPFYEDR